MLTQLLAAVVFLAPADKCAAPPERDDSPCSDRVGHCFDLAIDGQAVVALDDAALRARFADVASTPVCWHLAAPTAGAIEAVAKPNPHTAAQLGELYDELEVVVIPLEGQQVPTRKGVRTDPTVRIGGVPMQTVVDVVDVAALPDGAWIATFRVRGPGGWDRKAVYLEVARGRSP